MPDQDSEGKTKLPRAWNSVRVSVRSVNMNSSLPGSGQKLCSIAITMLLALAAMRQSTQAVEVWNGPTITFENFDGTDPTQAENQDRITSNVWLVRGASQGIYNAAVESSYTHSLSPVGTEWAYGALSNYASLNYTSWEGWFGGPAVGGPASSLGRDAVLHIIPGDIFLSVQFISWGVRMGGFSYVRSTPPVPEPSTSFIVLAGFVALGGFRSYRARRGEIKEK